MEDLKSLYQREVEFVPKLIEILPEIRENLPKFWQDKILVYIEDHNNSLEVPNYLDHPVNLFHLLKRTAMEATFIFTTLLSHGLTQVAVEDLKQILSPPKMEDFHRGGGLGILNLHCYYGFKPKDLIKGA